MWRPAGRSAASAQRTDPMTLYDHDGNRIEPGAILNEHWRYERVDRYPTDHDPHGLITVRHVHSGRETSLSAAAFGKIERPYGEAGPTSAELRRASVR